MDRRSFLSLTGAMLAAPLAIEAQQAGASYRIGYLSSGSASSLSPFREVFEEALRERGWVTGTNLVVVYRDAEGKDDRLPALALGLTLPPSLLRADQVIE